MRKRDRLLVSAGIICTLLSMYQLIVLELASFYTLFSIGMTLTLSCAYHSLAGKRLFTGWGIGPVAVFWVFMILVSIAIDLTGITAGYWEYPHYGKADQVRKYVFEWGVALFYHFVTLVIGVEVFKKAGVGLIPSLVLSLIVFVTGIGFITESLNLRVYSWRVTSMPLSNYRFGGYFLVFQTIGYWLMAIIPYAVYQSMELTLGRRFVNQFSEDSENE